MMDRPHPSTGIPGRFRILHVEDNPDDAFLMNHAFQRAAPGVIVTPLEDGRLAQEYLSRAGRPASTGHPPLPDLVLMDLKLPRMTGLELLEWMKSRPALKRLPVFILSSSLEPRDVDRARRLGVNGYLSKQATLTARMDVVQRLLAFINKGRPPSRNAKKGSPSGLFPPPKAGAGRRVP